MNLTLERAIALALAPALALTVFGAAAADQTPARDRSGPSSSAAQPSSAATSQPATGREGTNESIRKFEDIRASKLIGMYVRTPRNEKLGKIADLIVDPANGRVPFAILEVRGQFFVTEKLFVYPVTAFRPTVEGDLLELNVDKGKLETAQGFHADRWPDFSDPTYRKDLNVRFGLAEGAAIANSRLVRASKYLGKEVKDMQGQDIGELADLVVNLRNGNIRYSVVGFDKEWSTDDKLVAIPMRAYVFAPDRDELRVNVSREAVAKAPGFTAREWPMANIHSNAWLGEVDRSALSMIPPGTTQR